MLIRDGEEWYVVDPDPAPDPVLDPDGAGSEARELPLDAMPGFRRDPSTLGRPRYRSSWLVVLELADATGRTRALEVWADAVPATAFSRLHLACLFDAGPAAR